VEAAVLIMLLPELWGREEEKAALPIVGVAAMLAAVLLVAGGLPIRGGGWGSEDNPPLNLRALLGDTPHEEPP